MSYTASCVIYTHLLRNILSNYWCGMHLTCTNNSVKLTGMLRRFAVRNLSEVFFLRPCSKQLEVLMQLNHHERPNKKATVPSDNVGSKSDCENRTGTENWKRRKKTAWSTVQTDFCRYTSGRLPMHHQRMWASSLAVIPQTPSLPPAWKN